MKKNLYIAETDENGYVACVWVADAETKAAKVFDPHLHGYSLGAADVAGSSRKQIAAWIAARNSHDAGRNHHK